MRCFPISGARLSVPELGQGELPRGGLVRSVNLNPQKLELTERDLAFSEDETRCFLGFEDARICAVTEGWPIAAASFKVLLENGLSAGKISVRHRQALRSYLFCECVGRLNPETPDFSRDSACLGQLGPPFGRCSEPEEFPAYSGELGHAGSIHR